MSRAFTNVVVNSDTFFSWLGKTNDTLSTFAETVTIKANTAGDMTIGNGFVTGVFGANTLTATTIKGGNVQSNSVLSIASNTLIGNSSSEVVTLHNNVVHTKATVYNTSTTSAQIIDSFSTADYRSGKYLLSLTSSSSYQSTEIMILHDDVNALVTEYATLSTGSSLGTFVANVESTTVRLFLTPTNSSTTVKYHRTLIAV